jgi:glycosyltransferase involved in cell wall biosynthesis
MAEPGELAATLDLWRRDAAVRRSIGSRARQRAETAFSEERIVPLYQQMYQRVAGEAAIQ